MSLLGTTAQKSFYPTPERLVQRMLEGVEWGYVTSVLEPSAGKGDIVIGLVKALRYTYSRRGISVDCIEIDDNLRAVLKDNITKCNEDPQVDVAIRVIHDDFMTFRGYRKYDLIVMNPPFAQGAEHLVRAIELQIDRGGAIICLLNAETIKNPYTAARKLLKRLLDEHEASVEFIQDAFTDAERKTGVEVALIKIHFPVTKHESTIYEEMKRSTRIDEPDAAIQALVIGDKIESSIQMFNVEVEATLRFYREYKALCPYMTSSIPKDKSTSYELSPILKLSVGGRNVDSIDSYMRTVRLKYWEALYSNEEFMSKLTSKLRDEFYHNVQALKDYDYSAFNIKTLALEMDRRTNQGMHDAIIELFDKLTSTHSWYPECEKTLHYYDGWATNKAHKIGKKAIIPTHGVFSHSWATGKQEFDFRGAFSFVSDIEKALNYLSGLPADDRTVQLAMKRTEETGNYRNIECRYFFLDFFKKGTTHIKFKDMELVDRLNIYASMHKNWLPPNYGRATYTDLNKREKEVVDGFHGDGSANSGKRAYTKVYENSQYYLTLPKSSTLMLGESEEK